MTNARLKNKIAKFVQLNGADKWLLFLSAAWLAVARIMLAAFSFRRLSDWLCRGSGVGAIEPDPDYLKRVGHAVSAAANNVPWRSDCFPQTIAARMLLRRRGHNSTIHIGVERVGDDVLNGHAWLTCGDAVVVGGGDLDRYTELHILSS